MADSLIKKHDLLREFAGDINLIVSDIDHIFNEILCDYFFDSRKKKDIFTLLMLKSGGISFDSKANCIRHISYEIKNDKKGEEVEQAIICAWKFNNIKEKLYYGIKCIDNNSRKVEFKTIHGFNRWEYTEITCEYIGDVRDKGVEAMFNLRKARNTLIETIYPRRQKAEK